jgi:hypothetical protein
MNPTENALRIATEQRDALERIAIAQEARVELIRQNNAMVDAAVARLLSHLERVIP